MSNQVQIDNKSNWNDTFSDYPKEKALPWFLDECAKKYGNKIAIKFHDRELSFTSLYEQSNRLAKLLIESGVKTGDIVGIALDRSPELVISLIAILKSGAAYVPLDPEYPKDRVEFMLEDSSAKILLTSAKYKNHFQSKASEILIEDAVAKLDNYSAGPPAVKFGTDE